MSDMITVTIDDREVRAVLGRLAAKARSMAPLMCNLAAIMKAGVQENFIQEGRPKWKPSKRGGQTLRDSGRLFRSIIDRSDDHSAVVGTNVRYAPWLHFGTRPYQIKPKNKKALFWGGAAHPVKGVHHPGLVPRPFMLLPPSDLRRIEQAARRYLEEGT